jgi:hypothetical protein
MQPSVHIGVLHRTTRRMPPFDQSNMLTADLSRFLLEKQNSEELLITALVRYRLLAKALSMRPQFLGMGT